MVVPKMISYINISHFVILFVGVIHAEESKISSLTDINVEALLLFHNLLQLFLNHTVVVERFCVIDTSYNNVGKFWSPFQNFCL